MSRTASRRTALLVLAGAALLVGAVLDIGIIVRAIEAGNVASMVLGAILAIALVVAGYAIVVAASRSARRKPTP